MMQRLSEVFPILCIIVATLLSVVAGLSCSLRTHIRWNPIELYLNYNKTENMLVIVAGVLGALGVLLMFIMG